MSDITILEMIAGLRAQKEKIDRALAALEPLAGLQGESQWAGEVPKRTSVRKSKAPVERAKKRTSERTQGVAQEHVKTPKPVRGLDPFKPNSARNLMLRVLAEAGRPLSQPELIKHMLAAGWATAGEHMNVMQQMLYQMRQKGLVQLFGKRPNSTYGLPEQKPQEPQLFDAPSAHVTVRDLAVEVIAAAKQPLTTPEILTRMQARGWTTESAKPTDVVGGTLRYEQTRGNIKRYGKGMSGTWGLPGWGNAVKAMRAVQKTNGAVQEG